MSMKNYPPRPTVTDDMVREAAEAIAQNMDWGASAVDDIVAEYCHHHDGYYLAKRLDKWRYWDTTREDMEALDELVDDVSAALDDAESKWFAANNIQPPVPIGTRVATYDGPGVITGIAVSDVAAYLVKPEGQDDAACGERRIIMRFEYAEAAAEAVQQ